MKKIIINLTEQNEKEIIESLNKNKIKYFLEELKQRQYNKAFIENPGQYKKDILKQYSSFRPYLLTVLKDKYKNCYYCNKQLTNNNFTKDHIHPISKGGTNEIENLTLCCFSCNSSKKNNLGV